MKTESKQRYMIVLPLTVLTFIMFYVKPALKNVPSHSIAEVLGETLGIIAITYAWKKKYRNNFLITWLIFISMNLFIYLNDQNEK